MATGTRTRTVRARATKLLYEVSCPACGAEIEGPRSGSPLWREADLPAETICPGCGAHIRAEGAPEMAVADALRRINPE